MNKFKAILSATLLALLVGFAALVVAPRFLGNNTFSVQSGSMVPSISKGDLVNVKNVPIAQLKVGDVITFRSPSNESTTITHRIIEVPTVSTGSFVTQGDANPLPDDPISASSIVGMVDYSVPILGYATDFIRRPVGLLAVIYVPALLIISSEIKRLSLYYKRTQKYVLLGYANSTRALKFPKAMYSGFFIIASLIGFTIPVYAALSSSVLLAGTSINTGLLVVPPPNPPINCTVQNNTNITITNNNNQSSSSGSASSSTNTGGGNATSGSASNTNTSNGSITITNGPSCPSP